MASLDPYKAVVDRQLVDARTAQDTLHDTGRVIAYTDQPTYVIERADGTQFSWVADLCVPAGQYANGSPVSCRYRTEIGSEYWVHADRSVSYHSQPPSQLVAITADQIEADAAAGHLTPFRVSGDAPEGTA